MIFGGKQYMDSLQHLYYQNILITWVELLNTCVHLKWDIGPQLDTAFW